MDSLTQICLGAAVGGAVMAPAIRRLPVESRGAAIRYALLGGAALGTLPDLDVMIDYGDAVANYTHHRGFSHSLPVLGLLGILLGWLLAHLPRLAPLGRGRLIAYCLLCLITHPLLDAFTTYGTQLLWPWPSRPVSLASIFIIDPLYTLPLLITGLWVAIRGHAGRLLVSGLMLSSLYLGWGLAAKSWVEHRMAPVLASQGFADAPRMVQPTPFNSLLWRVSVVTPLADHEWMVGVFDSDEQLMALARRDFPRQPALDAEVGKLEDGQRLRWFAAPYLRASRERTSEGETLLAVTDTRLGSPGYHPFRFALARQTSTREWHSLDDSQRLPSQRVDRTALLSLWQAIHDPASRMQPGQRTVSATPSSPSTETR
ncbi:metal-dependent hydrolase [Cobetia sp. 10Alg 146]|uniref:metal-dependent hydrolase n=1 Tax=Cobetia sp. 10Alg 146 TaxID=3040019 RepID=UPI00244789B1|nr:metal-dependent hydrolase [Cobetia sp. 10Alg 146]MDH2292181.1 metal-dependent hydrolase [Cobetia sp. 10Alg 146]